MADPLVHGELPLATLPSGDLCLEIVAAAKGKPLASTSCPFRLVPAGLGAELCRADRFHRVMVCGSTPLTGLCGASVYPGSDTDEIAQAKMDDLKSHGAKCFLVEAYGASPERTRQFLDMAWKRGVKCLVALGLPQSVELPRAKVLAAMDYVVTLKDHPALLGYYLADEVVPTQLGYMSAVSPLFQALDPAHPMSMNLNHIQQTIKSWRRYQNDFTLIDEYASPRNTYNFIHAMRVDAPWTALFYWTRSYNESTGRAEPCPKNFLAGAYAGIVNGASIVAPFIYRPASTELFETWKTLADEMETLKDALATEDFADVSDPDGKAGASLRRTGSGVYVLAVSLAENKPETARLTLPGFEGKNCVAKVLFENREVQIKGGVLEDVFAHDDRHVYLIR